LPGPQTMDTIVQAPLDYAKLDEARAPVRIRLSSSVVRVGHDGPPGRARGVRVAYARGGRIHVARGRRAILAGYNALVPALVPELPDRQKQALAYSIKVPMLYTNVLIRRWTAFQSLGVASIQAPGMYHTNTSLDPGTKIGGYRGVTTPEEPIIVHM